jgi:Fic family protein
MNDIYELLKSELNISEILYHASLIHLKFAHLHPFMDGNGRIARILEKWFLSAQINSTFWFAPTEKYYKENLQDYYKNLNLGVNYYELDYDKCLPFLEMLPNALLMK